MPDAHARRLPRRARRCGLTTTAALLALGAAACSGDAGPRAEVVATIAVTPHVGPDLKVGPDGDVWLPASDTFGGTEVPYADAQNAIVRIDPDSRSVVASVAVPHPMSAIAVGESGVWATGTDFGPGEDTPHGSVVHVDPSTDTVVATVDLGVGSPSDVVLAFGDVWVSDSTANRVVRIDTATATVTAEIAVAGGPTSLAATSDAVWVTKPASGEVRPIDPETNTPGEPIGAGSSPAVLEADGDDVFVADYADEDIGLVRAGEGVTRRIDFPSAPSRLDAAEGRLLVAEVEGRFLSVVDGTDRRVVLEDRIFVAVAFSPDGRAAYGADPEAGAVVVLRLPALG